MGRVAIDQDTLLGGLFLSAILFAVLWFFFGITWWVIAAPVVLMTLVVLGSTVDDTDEAIVDHNILTAETPPPATVYEPEPTQPSMNLLTTDVDMDGERALEIIKLGVAIYDHTMTTLVEPGIARTTEFLTNRGAKVSEIALHASGFNEETDWLHDAIRNRRVDQDISAARLQKIFDQDHWPDPYRYYSRRVKCGFIDPSKHFAFGMGKRVSSAYCDAEVESLFAFFNFSDAFPGFCHLTLNANVLRITDADHYWDLWRSLVNRYGVPPDYESLNHWLGEGLGVWDYLHYFQVEDDEFVEQFEKFIVHMTHKTISEWTGPPEDLTPEIIESVCGADFRRLVKENPPTKIPWTPWI